ncbi:solute carrier family 22 member 7 isoform X2 [Mustela putorius furo]|uniref:Solute carrier family 22 member 7 isoform X2 n=1 Tax=Mustela putorius furo TaxID=9669 RepID=A0A8U0SPP3_MUSPF|nr:solute carrier family 22 member 7 isoform X2 [Mustela putorius furo]
MRFEELLEQVGGFGPFQLCNVALLALPRVLLPMHFLLPVFLAAIPAHRCALPGAPANFSHQDAWLEAHLPREPDGTLSSCLYFTHSQALPNTTFWGADQSPGQLEGEPSTAPCPQGWDYDRSEFSSTIATEVWETPSAAGGLCEFPGARPGVCSLGELHHVRHHPHPHWHSSGWLHHHRDATGNGMAGRGAPHRGRCPKRHLLDSGRDALGAGRIPDTGLAMASAGCHSALCPRHPQPLVGARVCTLASDPGPCGGGPQALNKVATRERVVQRPSYLDLFRTPRLRYISLCCMVMWFGVNFSYYGLSLDLSGLGLNVYQTQLLFGAVEVPSKLLVYLLVRHVGRRLTQAGMLLGTALALGTSLLVPSEMGAWSIALAVIGKGFSEGAFTTAYLFTSELYPTVLRQTGMGLTSLVGRLGGSLAPLAALLDGVWLPLPKLAYGGIALLAACTALLLPETRQAQLPETIQDVERSAPSSLQEEEMPMKQVQD